MRPAHLIAGLPCAVRVQRCAGRAVNMMASARTASKKLLGRGRKTLGLVALGVAVLLMGGLANVVFGDDIGHPPSLAATLTPTEATTAPSPDAPEGTPDDLQNVTALQTLDTLTVKGRAPKTGYSREQFGPRWQDVDRNGCDTRNDILARDLTDITRTGNCRVTTGTLDDPFTGQTIDFIRGQGTSELVQIDHVVALSDAWQKGAQQLSTDQRASFANDPLNLLAVDGSANAQKGDGDAATWLPKNRVFRCDYVARQVAVKAAYSLWVTPAEHDAITRVLNTCPDQPLPASTLSVPSS
ncbi:HNH endonuclease family protein [Microbacterium esteraromaticum]|uniref:HNH endonuclease family protein n=1 Tax=Microbacterium esteraromaticum TaxID=57043 RepID=UPI0028F6D012|nr:HNH endonuclease family protein [Microbacterium esteraromaticum]